MTKVEIQARIDACDLLAKHFMNRSCIDGGLEITDEISRLGKLATSLSEEAVYLIQQLKEVQDDKG